MARLSVGVLPAAASHPPMSLRYSPRRGESLPIDPTNIRVAPFPRCPARMGRLHSFSVPTGFGAYGVHAPRLVLTHRYGGLSHGSSDQPAANARHLGRIAWLLPTRA